MKDLFGSPVTVSVPARPDFVHVLRAVTAGVAARLDFSYDGIDDLRIAVDEACAHLLGVDADATSLTLRLTPSPQGLEILASIDAAAARPQPDVEGTLTWQVLSALADEIGFELGARGPTVRLVKRLPATGGRPGEDADA